MKKNLFYLLFLIFISLNLKSAHFSAGGLKFFANTPDSIHKQQDECGKALTDTLSQLFLHAKNTTIDLTMYILTDENLITRLLALAGQGATIRILLDDGQSKSYRTSALKRLQHPKILIRTLGTERQTMHEKLAIFSTHEVTRVVLGSFNWTASARHNNYEDCVKISANMTDPNDPLIPIIGQIKSHFENLWQKGTLYAGSPESTPSSRSMSVSPVAHEG